MTNQPGKTPLLCYITECQQYSGNGTEQREQLLVQITAAARAGIDLIQLRERELAIRDLEALASAAVAAVQRARIETESNTRLLINSRVDIAIACGADGVHLRSNARDISAADARAMFAKAGIHQALIGVSCHSAEDVPMATSEGADLAVFAPVFEKRDTTRSNNASEVGTARRNGVGLDALRRACGVSSGMPVLALGGVTLENAADCLRAGAAGVAGIRIFQQGDAAETIARLREIAKARGLAQS